MFLAAAYLALAALVGGAGLVAEKRGVPLSLLTRDLYSIAETPVYAGLLSNIGAFLWCAAAAVSFFAWAVTPSARKEAFLLATGGLSVMLLADDFWMFHEWLAPRFLGIREEAVFVTYGVLMVLYAVRYRQHILTVAPGFFLMALGTFALVEILDFFEPEDAEDWRYYLEDGLKIFGIVTWLAFAAAAAAAALAKERDEVVRG